MLASLRHPCKFQRVSRLGSVTAQHSSSGRQPNFAALNRGRHLYLAGRTSRWALAHISSYIFFGTDDVTVISVSTYTSVMGISIEDKYFIKSLRENKRYGAKRLLKLFPNKNWSLDGLNALIEKIDNTGTVWTVQGQPLPNTSNNSTCVVNYFSSALSVHQDSSFC